ncbi:hypothetical protein V1477_005949, partial [Vespula maculifrons]
IVLDRLATRSKTNSECGYMNMSMSVSKNYGNDNEKNDENKDDKDENNDNDDNNAKKEMIWDGIVSESCLSLCSKMQTSAQPFEM